MARQANLFPDPTTTIRVDATRQEPLLWVRRMVLFERPGQVLRELTFRRGLNVVWSPDPGAPAADLGRRGGSGHGAGKTLLCRMLRYCLGEDTFATAELAESIGAALPEGMIGAEVVIGGSTWGVVRPLGTMRRIVAGQRPPEDLLATDGRGTGMAPLLQAIRDAALGGVLDEDMPGARAWRSWLVALAWLTRDQECRFAHLLDWRHSKSNSGSPVPVSKEQLLIAVRFLIDSMSASEMKARSRLDGLAIKRRKLEAEVAYIAETAARLGPRLAGALEVDASLLGGGNLASSAIQARAQARLRDMEEIVSRDERDRDVPELRSKLERVVREIAILRAEMERTKGLVTLQQEQGKALRGERANLDADELKARLGPVCPVCSVPIDEALAAGCGLSHVVPDVERIASDKEQLAKKLAGCEGTIGEYARQLEEKGLVLRQLELSDRELREGIAAIDERSGLTRAARRAEWLAAAQVADDARRLVDAHAERERVEGQIASIDQEEARLKEKVQGLRAQHRETLDRVEGLFRYVCAGLLGSDTEASLTLTAQEIRAKVQVGGTAMESLKAIAFDIAVLILSIEGQANLPAFLVHDSPREADLGLSHYHRLFRFMAKLEELGTPPPFQYIITTTTAPPDELRAAPYLVAQLDGMDEGQRLVRRAL